MSLSQIASEARKGFGVTERDSPLAFEDERPKGWALLNARRWFERRRVSNCDSSKYTLDEATWKSLEGDRLYARIDLSRSFLGSQYLYSTLRQPSLDAKTLRQREDAFERLRANPVAARKIHQLLSELHQVQGWNLADLLVDDLSDLPFHRWFLWALVLFFHSALVSALVWGSWMWMLVLAAFGVCVYVHQRFSVLSATHTEALYALRHVVRTGDRVMRDPISASVFEESQLPHHLEKTRCLLKGGWLSEIQDPTGALEYFKVISLYDARYFAAQHRTVQDCKSSLIGICEALGFADFSLSVLELRQRFAARASTPTHCSSSSFVLQDCIHPLLDEETAIANSIELKQPGALLTGLNMAGKSTFLRSVAINVLLSQTIHTTLCSAYRGPIAKVFALMNNSDDLAQGKSFFMQELLSVKTLIEESKGDTPCLFVLDEMFRGTNSDERIASVSSVLSYLGQRKQVLVATHDMEVVELLSGSFSLFNFSGNIGAQGELVFDYRLKPGRCERRNAIRLMRDAGFPDEIWQEAQRTCDTVQESPATTH